MALEILLIVMVFCNDALSILENVGELDVPLPTFLKSASVRLRDRSSNGEDVALATDPQEPADKDDHVNG